MKIACAGASGTGKTTLAEWLARETGAPTCPVGSRSVARDMGLVDERGEPDPYLVDRERREGEGPRPTRAEFQRRLMASKRAWEDAHPRFVTDRTTLDNISYTILHDVSAATAEQLRSAVEGTRRYDRVLYFPASVYLRVGGDGARVGGKGAMPEEDARAYQDVFDALLFALLLRHRPDVIVVPVEGIEARRAWAKEALRL